MSMPLDIDFMVAMPSQVAADELAKLVAQRGYEPSVECDEETQQWTCYCKKRMVPSYEAIVGAQAELDELSASLGGHSDGWGTLGNSG